MVDNAHTDAPDVRRSRLWLTVLGGPLIWSVHFLIGYGYVEVACRVDQMQFNVLGLNSVAFVSAILTLVAVIVIGVVGFVAYRDWRRAQQTATDQSPGIQADERSSFMAMLGVLLAVLFGSLTLLTGIALVVLNPCATQ